MSRANPAARASFVIAIVLVLIAIVQQVINRFVPMLMVDLDWSTTQLSVAFAVMGFVTLVLSIFGLVFGIIGARRPGLTLQAGVGLGIAGFVAATSLVSLIASPLVELLYSL